MNNIIKKGLFINTVVKNGMIEKEYRLWVQRVGEVIAVFGIMGLMFIALFI